MDLWQLTISIVINVAFSFFVLRIFTAESVIRQYVNESLIRDLELANDVRKEMIRIRECHHQLIVDQNEFYEKFIEICRKDVE